MKIKFENNNIVIQSGLITKRIEVRRITKIFLGKCVVFYEGNAKLFSHKFCDELINISDMLFKEYYCEEIEYEFEDDIWKYWRKFLNEDFEKEIEEKREILDDILSKYNEKFDFELCKDVVIDSEKKTAFYKVWGEENGRQVMVNIGKENVPLYICVPIVAPIKLKKNESDNVLAVYDECEKLLKHNLDNFIKYTQNGLWKIVKEGAVSKRKSHTLLKAFTKCEVNWK